MVWEDQIGTATSIIDRIATRKDRLVVSLNLAAITVRKAAQTPIPYGFVTYIHASFMQEVFNIPQ